jgi:hypothetical protein
MTPALLLQGVRVQVAGRLLLQLPQLAVAAGEAVPLHYRPAGSSLDKVPATAYSVEHVLAEYEVAQGETDDFLAIVLARVERQYGLAGFAAGFKSHFEGFLQAADTDPAAPGPQPYRDPDGNPILTLAATQFFGPAQTWPRELYNHPYIEFWHRLDSDLAARSLPGMGPELIGDQVWRDLFSAGGYEKVACFMLPYLHPLLQVLRRGACIIEDRYFDITGWRVRLIDLESALRTLAPALEPP